VARIRIRNGHPSEVMRDDRRESIENLADDLRGCGYEVDLEIIERVPRIYGLTQIEWTASLSWGREQPRRSSPR
jgi:hypothetical protein